MISSSVYCFGGIFSWYSIITFLFVKIQDEMVLNQYNSHTIVMEI